MEIDIHFWERKARVEARKHWHSGQVSDDMALLFAPQHSSDTSIIGPFQDQMQMSSPVSVAT